MRATVYLCRSVYRGSYSGVLSNKAANKHYNLFLPRCASSDEYNQYVLPPRDIINIPTDITLHEYLFNEQERFSGKTYLVDSADGSSYTFAHVRDKSLQFASVLARLGVSKGDTVALIAPNCPEYFIAVFGTIILGGIVTTVSPSFTSGEIARQLSDSDATVVICHPDCYKQTENAQKTVNTVRHFITFGDEQNGAISLHNLLKKDDGKGLPSRVEINPLEDIALLPYSSGTTGLPKGVMLTHANLVANLHQASFPNVFDYRENDTLVAVLPLYHLYGYFMTNCLSYLLGLKAILLKNYSTAAFVDIIHKYQVSSLEVAPPIVSALCNDPYATLEKLRTVRQMYCGAAPLGPALYEKFVTKYKGEIKFHEIYGMTELSPMTHSRRVGNFVVGSCGTSVPNTFVKLVDLETGKPVGPGVRGELCIKGPQVMKGYWKNSEATKNSFKDGWFHTGDIAKLDEDENLYIVDRLKELIKVKGYQVAPAELEDLLRTHPSVDQVAVVGIPDERAGELPKAFVVPQKTAELVSEEELIRFVEGKVAAYKQLKGGLVFIDEIPKSPSGKILRRKLK